MPVKGGRAVVEDANGNVVCVVEGGPLRHEVTIANAQLIAAAPRLAAALNALLNELPSATTHPVIVEARDALREAGYER